MARLNGLATVAKRTGYPVKEVSGWKSRGSSSYNKPKSVIVHHTASGSRSGNAPSLGVVRNGRPGLPGPLCQILLARDGTIYIVASGRANHAGRVNATKYSNSNSIGIEAENNGVGEPWSDRQMDAYAKLCRELCDHYGISYSNVRGHKEVCSPRGRKIDPTFNMNTFRNMVKNRKGSGASGGGGGSSKPSSPTYKEVKYGTTLGLYDKGAPVKEWQEKALGYTGKKADGHFGPGTETDTKTFQRAHGVTADGLVGPNTWPLRNKAKPAPKKPMASKAPKFPLASGHWYGTESSSRKNHSGYYSKDRPGILQFQKKLKDRGWSISVDGIFGPGTDKVVRQFQKEMGLRVDGAVGSDTWSAIWNEKVT